MTKTTKEGEVYTVIKQYRNQSNNYKDNTKIYADLFKVRDKNNKISIICETDCEN